MKYKLILLRLASVKKQTQLLISKRNLKSFTGNTVHLNDEKTNCDTISIPSSLFFYIYQKLLDIKYIN